VSVNTVFRPTRFGYAAFRYEGPVTVLVGGVKFRARLNLARLLGQCLTNALHECAAEVLELILPVPLHPKRLLERGYNQVLEIARTIGRELSIPVDVHSCARVLATPPQARLAQKNADVTCVGHAPTGCRTGGDPR